MRRAELIAAVVMALFSIYLMFKSSELPVGWIEDEGPGGGAFPFWLSAIMLLSSLWVIVNWIRRVSPQSRSEQLYMDPQARKKFLLVGSGVTAMIGLVYFVGMYGAILVFLIYYIRFLGRHSWPTTLSISVSAPVVTFFFFDVAMRIILPKGFLLEPYFEPLYDIFL